MLSLSLCIQRSQCNSPYSYSRPEHLKQSVAPEQGLELHSEHFSPLSAEMLIREHQKDTISPFEYVSYKLDYLFGGKSAGDTVK